MAARASFSLTVTLLVMTSTCLGMMVIDLSYELKEGENIMWPIFRHYELTIGHRGYGALGDNKNVWLEYNYLFFNEHTGTHFDAPVHVNGKGNWKNHQVPPEHLVGPGVVVDVTEKVNGNDTYALTVDDLKNWEKVHGKIPNGAVVLMKTGWGKRYPNKNRVFNTDNITDTNSFKFPGFSIEAGLWLAEQRNVIAIGIDTPSPDVGSDHGFPIHMNLLPKNILLLENVAHLERLPPKGTIIVIGAIKIYDGSGGPMRLLALLDLDKMYKEIMTKDSATAQAASGALLMLAAVCVRLCGD